MKKKLVISTIQTQLSWEDRTANLKAFDRWISECPQSDIIVLPEAFTSGFSMEPKRFAEKWKRDDTETVIWMTEWAEKKDVAITGSIVVKDEGQFFNRLIWVEPGGIIRTYDKRHLFTMAGEDRFYEAGKERLIVGYKGWEICPLICYDLRFPLWCRNSIETGEALFDLQIFVANWPAPRINAWNDLLRARAIENQVYVVGVNRIGSDDTGKEYTGDSVIIDFKGVEKRHHPPGEAGIATATLDYEALQAFRQKFPVLNDADLFFLK